MELKEEIESLLIQLKNIGISRRDAEGALHYKPKAIDQALSRGGNETLRDRLKALLEKETVLQQVDEKINAFLKGISVQLIEMDNKLDVLRNYIMELKHKATGDSIAKISLDMEQTTRDFLKNRQELLKMK